MARQRDYPEATVKCIMKQLVQVKSLVAGNERAEVPMGSFPVPHQQCM